MIKRLLVGIIVVTAFAVSCLASSIPVYGTGLNSGGVLLPGGAVDPHWTIAGGIVGATNALVYDGGYPIGPWAADGPSSMWISPTADTFGPQGTYVYQTSFDLTGFDALTAQLSGTWATDDAAAAYLNGHALGALPFGTPGVFSVTNSAYFLDGINILQIDVYNDGGPTGLRVNLSGAADISSAPEPATLLFAALGLSGIAVVKRRRRASR